jgi:type I restriction enzyme S subunit
MIPKNWVSRELGDLADFVNGRGFKPHEWSDSGLPIIRIQNLNGSTEFNYFSGAYEPKIEVNSGELLFAWSGSRGTSFGPHFWHGGKAVLNYHTWKVVPTSNEIDKRFLFDALKLLTARIEDEAHGAAALVHTQKNRIVAYSIWLPPIPEQRKIAAILSTWDRAIGLTEKLVVVKQQRKAALIQQLLTGRVRLPGFTAKWQIEKAGDIFKAVSTKNHPDERVLSVTQDMGVVNRDEMDRKIGMSLDNTSGYKLVRPGDFIISLRSFQGGLEMSRLRGIVSPAYHVIHPVIDIDREFFRHYFKSYEFIGRLGVAVIGIRDGKQISFEDFGFMNFRVPSLAEQAAIASVLNAADEEIALHTRKLDALRRHKKGLMQQLLTGKVRVQS